MNDMLQRLYAGKAVALERERQAEPLESVEARARVRFDDRRAFRASLERSSGPAVIAEIKRASPSRGLIVREIDPAAIAARYDRAGADAISVLTEADHFLGDLAYLDIVRAMTSLPILRKDFLSDRYAIVQSAAYGADAILAIVGGIDDATLEMMLDEAKRWNLDVLVEVHDENELRRAILAGATLVGINNRDLRTFETSLAVASELLPLVPSGVIAISESGVKTWEDTQALVTAGARGFLIGEALMLAEDPRDLIAGIKAAAISRETASS